MGPTRACWAVTREEAPGRGFPRSGLRAYLVWLGCLVPGLYEVIQYTLSLHEGTAVVSGNDFLHYTHTCSPRPSRAARSPFPRAVAASSEGHLIPPLTARCSNSSSASARASCETTKWDQPVPADALAGGGYSPRLRRVAAPLCPQHTTARGQRGVSAIGKAASSQRRRG